MSEQRDLPSRSLSDVDSEVARRYPFTEVVSHVAKMCGACSDAEAARVLLYTQRIVPTVDNKAQRNLLWYPSIRFRDDRPGPFRDMSVAVIGKVIRRDDDEKRQAYAGAGGRLLRESLEQYGGGAILDDTYGMSLIRYLPEDGGSRLLKGALADCLPFLMQELYFMRPRFMLLLGADVVKTIIGRRVTLSAVRSRYLWLRSLDDIGEEKVVDINEVPQEEVDQGICVYAMQDPAAIVREEGLKSGFSVDVQKFCQMVLGQRSNAVVGADCDYRTVSTAGELKVTVDELLGSGVSELAVDCEWGGGGHLVGQLRTIQFSWAPKKACVVVLRRAGLVAAQNPIEQAALIRELKRLFDQPQMRFIGHNIRADTLWLDQLDLCIQERVSFDTMLASHVLQENAEHGLEACTGRLTTMGRYDEPVQTWLKRNRINVAERGYADVPDELLHVYGAADADVTFRIAQCLRDMLNKSPENDNIKKCYYSLVLPCSNAIHRIESLGMAVDREHMIKCCQMYEETKQELESHLKLLLKNDNFNFRSVPQVVKLLYGNKDVGGLELQPLKTTTKPTKMWVDVPADEQYRYSPSTDAESLEYLEATHSNPILQTLADLRKVDQIAKSFLRLPNSEEEYTKGLVGSTDPDGRVRTSISQMSETGRWKSSRPNLQNLPSKQVGELKRILGEEREVAARVRGCFIASPGMVMIGADYKSAEIFTLGYLAGCDDLVRDAGADLHARGAVNYFHAEKWPGFDEYKAPPEEWKSKNKALRISAKTVNFGIPYQRGAEAVAREIEKSTKGAVTCTKQEAQQFIDNYYATYPQVKNYVEMCKQAVISEPYYLETPFGRRRNFTPTEDRSVVSQQQREAVNFPIQSTVADTLNQALIALELFKVNFPFAAEFQVLLGVHDAFLIECPGRYVPAMVDTIIPLCMGEVSPVPRWFPPVEGPGGKFYQEPTKGFFLDVDVELMLRWGDEVEKDELMARGVPEAWLAARS